MKKKGFTLTEIIISTLVLSIIAIVVMYLFQRSNAAFSITVWKQERAAQAETFWSHFRKHIEEASDLLEIPDSQMGKPHPEVKKIESRPILVHTSPNTVQGKENILAWNVSHLDFDFSSAGAHSSSSTIYYLVKDDKKVYLIEGRGTKPIAELDDVTDINFDTRSLKYTSERSYTTIVGKDESVPIEEVAGTLLEITLTITPPKNYIGEGNRIPHSNKFKLNVASKKTNNVSYQ
jgi:prepilin-type N-terminal cleavage/methylation domain-containing protein